MTRSVCVSWLLACCLLCPAVWASEEIESSISTDNMMGSLRFYGVTKTMTTTTTVVHLHTKYVHQSCLFIPLGTPTCPNTTPEPPTTTTTTTTPAPTTTTTTTTPAPTTTTTTAATTTAAGGTTTPNTPFKVVEGQFKPSVSTSITVNKLGPPKIQFNLPQLLTGQGAGLGNVFNKNPLNINVAANMTATVHPVVGRRRRSEILSDNNIQPSLVRAVEMTASPEMSLREAIQQDVDVEASKAEEYHEYEITGLMPHHFAERALPFLGGNKVTIVRVDPVTVTVKQTVTSQFPFVNPTDRVTVIYFGCAPSKVPDLPHCV